MGCNHNWRLLYPEMDNVFRICTICGETQLNDTRLHKWVSLEFSDWLKTIENFKKHYINDKAKLQEAQLRIEKGKTQALEWLSRLASEGEKHEC